MLALRGVAGAIGVGGLSLVAFVAWAMRVKSPAIDLTLFRDRTYRWINAATLVYGTAFAMMFFSIFQFATSIWHYSLAHAGIAASPGPHPGQQMASSAAANSRLEVLLLRFTFNSVATGVSSRT